MFDQLDVIVSLVLIKNFFEMLICHSLWRSLPYNRVMNWVSQKENPVSYMIVFTIALVSHGILILFYTAKFVAYFANRADLAMRVSSTSLTGSYQTPVIITLFLPVLLCFTYSIMKYLIGFISLILMPFGKK